MRVRTDSELPRVDHKPYDKVGKKEVKPEEKKHFDSKAQQQEYEKRTGRNDRFSTGIRPQHGNSVHGSTNGITSVTTGRIDPKSMGELDITKGKAMLAEAGDLRARADEFDERAAGLRTSPKGEGTAVWYEKMATSYRATADKLEAGGKALIETGEKIIAEGRLPDGGVFGHVQTPGASSTVVGHCAPAVTP